MTTRGSACIQSRYISLSKESDVNPSAPQAMKLLSGSRAQARREENLGCFFAYSCVLAYSSVAVRAERGKWGGCSRADARVAYSLFLWLRSNP